MENESDEVPNRTIFGVLGLEGPFGVVLPDFIPLRRALLVGEAGLLQAGVVFDGDEVFDFTTTADGWIVGFFGSVDD